MPQTSLSANGTLLVTDPVSGKTSSVDQISQVMLETFSARLLALLEVNAKFKLWASTRMVNSLTISNQTQIS